MECIAVFGPCPHSAGVGRGRFLEPSAAVLRACAMYWHFVVALWPVLYVTVYLL